MILKDGAACLRNLIHLFRPASSSLTSKLGACYFCTSHVASLQQPGKPSVFSDDEYADLDWDNLGFSIKPADYMYTMKCSKHENFKQGQLSRYANIELSPSAAVLNYGQGVYEGTKAYRTEDGRILLFRPDLNASRMKIGAERMCMPSPSVDQFVDAVKQIALANKRWEGSAPLNLYIEEEFVRAAPGGAGGVKAMSNYAPVLKALIRAKSRGFSDVLYLDSVNRKNVEEVSSCNIFVVKGNVISTPATNGTILEGITRRSVIEIARDYGYQVEERVIPVDELINADQVFCTGTAVVVAPVGSITYQNKRVEFKTGSRSVYQELYSTLVGIQTGVIEDKKGWTVEV
ncbi:Branched-chain-amino-acid aminotransferase 2 [Citrus sinensis]|uniref:Branched-chain-amino-acid aminotransferase 2 n=1 Tax=Citrus sinensis TaxID=2711 RepID=A0ACB8KNL1_CITSI|nr:Branched-chain-amino-acid aminotransferase 2 [Citrus sinensis]